MKITVFYRLVMFLVFAVAVLSACQDEEVVDSVPPGKVSNVQITSDHGGAVISYDLPDDDDLLYVKANYVNSNGDKLFKVCSFYDNEIEIDGYNDTLSHEVQLVAVDRYDNQSEPVVETFNPLKSHIELVKESTELNPDFGGVSISWDNPSKKTVYTHFSYEDSEGNNIVRFLSSSRAHEKFVVRDMDTTRKEFFVQVEDFYGNKTEKVSKGSYSPWHEEKIDKSLWTLVSNMSVDGNAWEGSTVNLWDNVVDTKESASDDSYAMIWRNNNGGQLNYPLDIVIDMNSSVIVNRFVVWQRAFWYGNEEEYFYYQAENIKSFNLYTSNDKMNWTFVGEFSIEDPKDEDGNVSEAAIQEAIDGHNFELDQFTEPFRYLKFSITENFGSEEYVNVSEISLFGTMD
jgi:hypothetical protein